MPSNDLMLSWQSFAALSPTTDTFDYFNRPSVEFDHFMRLALLCDDIGVIPWLDAIENDPTHELSLAATLTEPASQLLRERRGIRLTSRWEDLVQAFDAVLVGGSDERELDAIKQLANAGQRLLFLPSTSQGSTFIYELSLIRDDNRVSLMPAVWHRCDPVLLSLRDTLRSGSLGQVHLLQVQREFVGNDQSSTLAQTDVDAAMLLDFDLLRWFSGDYDQVTALRTGASNGIVRTQSVKLSGRGLPEATWDAQSGTTPYCRLVIQTDRGPVRLERPAEGNWILNEPNGVRREGNQIEAIREYLRLANSESQMPMEWPELVKLFETADASHRSVARRRTIDLHFEPMSERAIFKTQMTAMGCGVLIATFLLVLIYLAIASTLPLPHSALVVLRTLIFAPLGLFLLLQLLFPLTRPSDSNSG
jgi:hypothetical protein